MSIEQAALVITGNIVMVLLLGRIGYLFKKKGSPRE